MAVTLEQTFNQLKRFNPKNAPSLIRSQVDAILNSPEISVEQIGDYYCVKLNTEYFTIKKDYSVFKSFPNKRYAIDYCLDKLNTESKQQSLF